MAIDKAIDSAVLDANLTTVADAIRAKGGTSEPLSFPTGFADAISAIQAGGGGGGIIEKGTITKEENSSAFEVRLTKNKWNGTLPQYIVILKQRTADETITSDSDCLVAYFWECVSVDFEYSSGYIRVRANVTEIGYQGNNLKIPCFKYNKSMLFSKSLMDNDSINLHGILDNPFGMYMRAGVTYEWVAIGGL